MFSEIVANRMHTAQFRDDGRSNKLGVLLFNNMEWALPFWVN